MLPFPDTTGRRVIRCSGRRRTWTTDGRVAGSPAASSPFKPLNASRRHSMISGSLAASRGLNPRWRSNSRTAKSWRAGCAIRCIADTQISHSERSASIAGRLLPQRPIDAWRLGRDDRIGMAPDPTTMYVVGLGLAVLAGASWYIRRRKW